MKSSPSRFTACQWVAALLPAALLLVVAGNQVRLVHQGNLTPWKGGGFGMYSTIDSGPARLVDIVLVTDGAAVRLRPKGLADWRLRRRAQQVLFSPTAERLEALVDRLLGADLDRITKQPAAAEPVRAARITVWRYAYDRATGRLAPTLWMSAEKASRGVE